MKSVKISSYKHCTICADFKNYADPHHRASPIHQDKLKKKLKKIFHYMIQLKKKPVVVHDGEWPEKDLTYFCHFCSSTYPKHNLNDEFVFEDLGCLFHHANEQHTEAVKKFLRENGRKDAFESFCIKQSELNRFLERIPEAKCKYLKKMEILNEMDVKQIKEAAERRQRIVSEFVQSTSSVTDEGCIASRENLACGSKPVSFKDKTQPYEKNQVPPWLEEQSPGIATSGNHQSNEIIGPTVDAYLKYRNDQAKKGLNVNRVGANFNRNAQWPSGLPSFHGVWNRARYQQRKKKSKKL